MYNIVIVDYGLGNLKSVYQSLEKFNVKVTISSKPEEIYQADKLILPGVGSFVSGMKGLAINGKDEAIVRFIKKGNFFLGICLGMQMLMEISNEHGASEGLSMLEGDVTIIPQSYKDITNYRKIPHIGWSTISNAKDDLTTWNNSILKDVNNFNYFYFVHSYMVNLKHEKYKLAVCNYSNQEIVAAFQKENITGLQFHPENSANNGLRIYDNFL